jgi:hypothetical protein
MQDYICKGGKGEEKVREGEESGGKKETHYAFIKRYKARNKSGVKIDGKRNRKRRKKAREGAKRDGKKDG